MHKKQLIIENITFEELTDALVKKLRITPAKPKPEENYLTQKEAAIKLRVSTRTIHNWIKSGTLPCYQCGNRSYLKSSDIESKLIRKEF